MSWESVDIEVGGKSYSGHVMSDGEQTIFNIPPASELEVGGKFKCGGKSFTAVSVHDVAQRGEELLVETKEMYSGGKPKARRNDDNSGGEEVQSEGDS